LRRPIAPDPSPWHAPTPARRTLGRRLLILSAVAALLLAGLFSVAPPAALRSGDEVYLARYLLIGAAVIVILAASRRNLLLVASQVSVWLVLILALVAVYAYRTDLTEIGERTLGELTPTRGQSGNNGGITFTRTADRQFWIDAEINGRAVRFLLDTGASGIILNRQDALRLGFDPNNLSFEQIFETANGRTRGASIELGELRIGPLSFEHVAAWVNEGDLRQSLLGMTFLERLSSVELRGDRLTIRR
jgi:aspartyl protease family protein